jgi:hypothetical protein
MQVASSGIGSAPGYASPVQSSSTRPPQDGTEKASQGQGGPQAAAGGENQPVNDPTATRGRNLNISV